MSNPIYLFQVSANSTVWQTVHTSESSTDTNGVIGASIRNTSLTSLKIVRTYNENSTELLRFDLNQERQELAIKVQQDSERTQALQEKTAPKNDDQHNKYVADALASRERKAAAADPDASPTRKGRKAKAVVDPETPSDPPDNGEDPENNSSEDNEPEEDSSESDDGSGTPKPAVSDKVLDELNLKLDAKNTDDTDEDELEYPDWSENDIFEKENCPKTLFDLSVKFMDEVEDYQNLSKTNKDSKWIYSIDCGDRDLNQAFAERCVEFAEECGLKAIVKARRGRGTGRWVIVGKTEHQIETRTKMA